MLAGLAAVVIFFVWLYHHNQYALSFPMWLDAEDLAESENQTAEVVEIEYDYVDDNLGELAEAKDQVVVSFVSETAWHNQATDFQVDMLYEGGWITVYRPYGLYGKPRGIKSMGFPVLNPGPNKKVFSLPKGVLRSGVSYRLRFLGRWVAWFEVE